MLDGARLVEVGTTNRTRLADYERAITAETAAILRVHPSNYRVVGFTATPSLAELAELGAAMRSAQEDLDAGAQELVLVAQRFDVTEEVDRLSGHVAEVRAVLELLGDTRRDQRGLGKLHAPFRRHRTCRPRSAA